MEKKSSIHEVLKREKELKAQEKEKHKHVHAKPAAKSSDEGTQLNDWEKKFNTGLIETTNDIRFYFLKEEFLDGFKKQYKQHFDDLEKFGISAYKFLDYARESFERFKNMKSQLPLEQMNKKSFDYAKGSIDTLMEKLADKLK